MMALVSGLVCVLIGILRLGFVTELLSKPIRYGYIRMRCHSVGPWHAGPHGVGRCRHLHFQR
jgi:hypothetical protein